MITRRYDYEAKRSIALFMIENGATLRQMEKKFRISKSSLHKFLQVQLKEDDYQTYLQARILLEKNKAERAVRGGMATRKKFLNSRF